MLLWIILGIVLLFLLLLLFVPAKISLIYRLQEGQQKLRMKLRILFIPVGFDIPLDKDNNKADKDAKKETEKRKSPKEFIAFSKRLYYTFQEVKGECKDLFGEIRAKLVCSEVSFALRYGTGNPAATGMLNGAIWAASAGIVKLFDTTFSVTNKSLTVEPVFDKACLTIHSKTSFTFKLFDALLMLCKIKTLVKKIKDKIKTEN